MYKTPYHGLNLCVGVTAESLKDVNKEIHPILRYLGERKQIFNVHFRNVKGGWDHFMEVSVDDGTMDMYQVMKTLRDVGYPYGIQPDHTLRQPEGGDPGAGQQYTAFCFGYIKALIEAVNKEA
jgi:mannonate dehydratase